MKYLFIFLFLIGKAYADEAFIKELESHIMQGRLQKENKEYLRSLPPEALNLIVDEFIMDGRRRGRNDAIFSAASLHLRQLEKDKTPYDKDYTIGKLVEFARYRIDNKASAGAFMNYFMGLDHPLVLELAKDILSSGDELAQRNAKLLIQRHEDKKRLEIQRKNRGSRATDRENAGILSHNGNQNSSSAQLASDNTTSSSAPSTWVYGLCGVFLVASIALVAKVSAEKKKIAGQNSIEPPSHE